MSDQNVNNNSNPTALTSIRWLLIAILVVLCLQFLGPGRCPKCEGDKGYVERCEWCGKTGIKLFVR